MRILVDADSMVYGCGFAAEGEPVTHALRLVKNKYTTMRKYFNPCTFITYISGPQENLWRKIKYPDYKANRADSPKPEHYDAIRTYLLERYDTVMCTDQEADDVCCWTQTAGTGYSMFNPDDFRGRGASHDADYPSIIVASIDKDLNQAPGWKWNYNKEIFYYVSVEDSILWWASQMIMGDKTDGIDGIPGLGKARTSKLLEPLLEIDDLIYEDAEALVRTIYYDFHMTQEEYIKNWDLLTMEQTGHEHYKPKATIS